ncbi:MAG: hypothetical protein ACR2PW_03405 [Gammaproteobacteria bacterium]
MVTTLPVYFATLPADLMRFSWVSLVRQSQHSVSPLTDASSISSSDPC